MRRVATAVVLSIWSGLALGQSSVLPRGKPKTPPKAPAGTAGTTTATGTAVPVTPAPAGGALPVDGAVPGADAAALATPAASQAPTTPAAAEVPATPTAKAATPAPTPAVNVTPGFTPLALSPCQDVFATIRGGEGFFSKGGQAFFFVSRPSTRSKSSEGFFDVYEMDVLSGVIKRLLGVEFGDSYSFIGQGYPLNALGIYGFKEFGPECLQGRGNIQALVLLNKQEPKLNAVFSEGNYSVLYGARTSTLLDNTEGTVKEFDIVSGQKRTIAKIQNKSIPFLYDKPNNKLLAYEIDDQELTVTKLSIPGQKVDLKVKMPINTKIFVDGDRVGFIVRDVDANEITVREVKGLTGTVNVVHKFAFPKGYSVLEAGFVGNLEKRLIAVTAFKQEKRKSWTRTFLVDYLAKKIITVQKLPEKHHVSSMYFNADGTLWVSMIKDDANRLSGISIYNMSKNKWFTPKLPK